MADRITLEDLRPAEGSTGKSKRVGRGRSSGHGKTSCRGHNGEGQRSGRSSKRGFEGGQMPAYRRLPKLKGFQVYSKLNYAQINVGRLADLEITEISLEQFINSLKFENCPRDKLEQLITKELIKRCNLNTSIQNLYINALNFFCYR